MTRAVRMLLRMAVLVSASTAILWAQEGREADRQAFDRLASLVGTWSMTERDNPATRETVTYSVTGRGTVLIESMQPPTTPMGHMLTAYHLDKGQLVLTHFCGAGNQPRMRLSDVSDGGRRISFAMYDITNLSSPAAYHSTNVDVAFLGDTRVDITYRGRAGGKEYVQVFQLARVAAVAP